VIHAFARGTEGADGRDKPGHDEIENRGEVRRRTNCSPFIAATAWVAATTRLT
jgi:hypothetical protein